MKPPCPPFHRRDLIKASAAGGLLFSCLDATGKDTKPGHASPASDLVRGVVPRTDGKLMCAGEVFRESSRDLLVAGKCGVLVCGGGPAGIAAALAAAREGADVRLLEVAGCLGGIWTCGLLTKILDAGNKPGIMSELLQAFAQKGSQVAKSTKGTVYDPEVAKVVLEELLVEAGVKILYHTRVVGAARDGSRISAVITESKAGRQAWCAERYIDCTGDGDLAAQAGKPTPDPSHCSSK
jgi:NADPH-dependent 2,4-dienoyl-CoA reductase/sulfur reductase-like enzyme